MKPQEWPITASTVEGTSTSPTAARGRISTVRVDYFLNPSERLTEQERALMSAMLHCLITDISIEVRAALPSGWLPESDEDGVIAAKLTSAGLLDEPGLIGLLLRRANEERIASAARLRSGRTEARAIQGLLSHSNDAVSVAAMALIVARGRRRNRFGQFMLSLDDLPAETADRLVYSVAALFRPAAILRHGAAHADSELAGRSAEILTKRDQMRGLDALRRALVETLDEAGGLTDEFLIKCLQDGEIGFFAEVLGRRCGLSSAVAFSELLSLNAKRAMALMRVAACSRELATALIASIGDLLGIEAADEAIEAFDGASAQDLKAVATWLAAAPEYWAAVEVLGNSNG